MTHAERVSAVAALGFTERQAAFLVLVMLHSGVCVGRQYCAFAGIVRGQKMADFFQKLSAKRFATPYPCGHNKARVYHVHNAKLYDAIGQRDVRFRKRSALARTIERVMMLDHIIAHRDITWLGAEHDKVAHFLTTMSLRREELPRLTFGRGADVTVRYFPDKLPIGVSLDGRCHVLLYLLSGPICRDPVECLKLRPIVAKIGRRHRKVWRGGRLFEQTHEAIRIRVRQWRHENPLHGAEDCGICANGQRESQCRRGGEGRRPLQQSDRVADILQKGFHRAVSFGPVDRGAHIPLRESWASYLRR